MATKWPNSPIDTLPFIFDHFIFNKVIFDTTISFTNHIYQTIKSIYYQTHQLRLIRKPISIDTAKLIASACILRIFDYCNSPANTSKLPSQMYFQNKPLTLAPNTPKDLYKTLLLTHKSLHHNFPSYLTNLIPLERTYTTITRSTNTFLIELPSKYKKYLHQHPIMVNICPLQLEHYTAPPPQITPNHQHLYFQVPPQNLPFQNRTLLITSLN